MRNAIETEFMKINNEETFWNYYNNTFGSLLFSDWDLQKVLKPPKGRVNPNEDPGQILKGTIIVGGI